MGDPVCWIKLVRGDRPFKVTKHVEASTPGWPKSIIPDKSGPPQWKQRPRKNRTDEDEGNFSEASNERTDEGSTPPLAGGQKRELKRKRASHVQHTNAPEYAARNRWEEKEIKKGLNHNDPSLIECPGGKLFKKTLLAEVVSKP